MFLNLWRLQSYKSSKFELHKNSVFALETEVLKLCRLVTLQTLEVQEQTVPHFKAPICL